jgi:transcription initiation factor TFIID TATA-box-binding protein
LLTTKDLNDKLGSYRIQNIIVTADLKQPINITRFNDYAWGRYDIENNYNGRVGYVKDKGMQGRVSVFTTGKLISTGAKSILHSIVQLEHTKNNLVRNGLAKKVTLRPKVQNIVATASVGGQIDLNHVAKVMPRSIYEPEQFPGLIHKTDGGPTFLIFASGKIIIAGAKSELELTKFLNAVLRALRQFKA